MDYVGMSVLSVSCHKCYRDYLYGYHFIHSCLGCSFGFNYLLVKLYDYVARYSEYPHTCSEQCHQQYIFLRYSQQLLLITIDVAEVIINALLDAVARLLFTRQLQVVGWRYGPRLRRNKTRLKDRNFP